MITADKIQKIIDTLENHTKEILKPYNMQVQLHNLRYSGSSFTVTVQGIERDSKTSEDRLNENLFKEIAKLKGFDGNSYKKIITLNNRDYEVFGMSSTPDFINLRELATNDLVKISIDDFKRVYFEK